MGSNIVFYLLGDLCTENVLAAQELYLTREMEHRD